MLDGNVMFSKPYDMKELADTVKKLSGDEKKILIVDDEIDVLKVLEKGLAEEDYSVITADSGSAALESAKSNHPDLIILDLEMPDMYGGDIARMLKEDPEIQDTPIMFLTGMFPKKDEPDGGRLIAGHVLLSKPYDIKELVRTIKKCLQETKSLVE